MGNNANLSKNVKLSHFILKQTWYFKDFNKGDVQVSEDWIFLYKRDINC